jgi:hypothetical protein
LNILWLLVALAAAEIVLLVVGLVGIERHLALLFQRVQQLL